MISMSLRSAVLRRRRRGRARRTRLAVAVPHRRRAGAAVHRGGDGQQLRRRDDSATAGSVRPQLTAPGRSSEHRGPAPGARSGSTPARRAAVFDKPPAVTESRREAGSPPSRSAAVPDGFPRGRPAPSSFACPRTSLREQRPMTDRCSAKGCQRRRRLGAALEQPEAAHPGAPQDLAGVRRAPHVAVGLPRRPGLPQGRRRPRGLLDRRRYICADRRSAHICAARQSAHICADSARISPRWRTSGGRAGGTTGRRCRGRRACRAWRPPSGRRSPRRRRRRAGPPRRSDSSRANRQLRTWPSAVRRTRSQSPQNGRVTEAITPTVAGPPSTRNSSAGALPRGSSAGERSNSALSRSKISSAVTMPSRLQPCWASSGICSMKRSS